MSTSELKQSIQQVHPLIDSTKETLAALGSDVKERAGQVAKKTDAYAHTNPWQVAGVAALLGAAVGVLATRRR